MSDPEDLDAGEFSQWLGEMQARSAASERLTFRARGCTACCTASQFVHIGPDETDTLAHIPRELLFPAPRMPRGHVLLGYDERGHCPMLVDDQCSIYDHRPQTCRTYDCRIFPAAGIEMDDADKALIARQTRRWKFSFPTDSDHDLHNAVKAAAKHLEGTVPTNATERAVRAIETHEAFLDDPVASGRCAIRTMRNNVACSWASGASYWQSRSVSPRPEPSRSSRPPRRPRPAPATNSAAAPKLSGRYVALGDGVPYGHGLANPGKKKIDGLGPNQPPSRNAYPSRLAKSLGLTLTVRAKGCTLGGGQLAVSGAPGVADNVNGHDVDCGSSAAAQGRRPRRAQASSARPRRSS